MRNTPLLIQIYIIYFGFSMVGFGLSGFSSGLLALCIQNGGYVAEIYRGGLQSVSQLQYEAGRALGMRRWTLYTTVIMPQVIARVIPPMTNQAISIIKDTSQVAAIAVMEMMKVAEVWVESSANTYDVFAGVAHHLSGVDLGCRLHRQGRGAAAGVRAMKMLAPLLHSYWYLFRGAGMTLLMAAASVLPATALGIVLALVHVFGRPVARSVLQVYLFLVRGIPLLVLLTFVYYLLPLTGIDLPPFWGVVMVMSLYYAAFMSEVFRAGIESLPQAQWDAARSLGMHAPPDAAHRHLPPGAAPGRAAVRQPVRQPGEGHLADLHRRAVGADDGQPRGGGAHAGTVPDLHRCRADLFLHLLHPGPVWTTP